MASLFPRRGLTALLALTALSGCTGDQLDDALWGVYFVKLDANPAEVAGLAAEISNELNLEILQIYDAASEGFSVQLPHIIVPELEQVDGVELVVEDKEKNYVVPEDPDSSYEYGDSEVPDGIFRIGGPYQGSLDLSGIEVAVIDTGIDSSHSDLNVVGDADIVCESWDDCANGGDPNGHGTHVAGTIGAIADGSGVAGVAPGVKLHAVRVLGADGSGYYSDIIAGIEYVLENPEIRVVNMSLGGTMSSATDPLAEAIQRLIDSGVIVCIAAGNESQDTANVSPAGYDLGVVVSAYDASNSDLGFAWFSNFGGEVDIAAPGVSIYSTWPGGGHEALDGTSMATPHVAGAAALYLAQDDSRTPDQFRDDVISGGENGYYDQGGDHSEPLLNLTGLLD
ncbi:MAG: subtilisin [Myxococcota bacterium]|jgi:subtilisin